MEDDDGHALQVLQHLHQVRRRIAPSFRVVVFHFFVFVFHFRFLFRVLSVLLHHRAALVPAFDSLYGSASARSFVARLRLLPAQLSVSTQPALACTSHDTRRDATRHDTTRHDTTRHDTTRGTQAAP
jgi:hypothetical protein